jgi:thiol-disulfide isomerase/thioredoxin
VNGKVLAAVVVLAGLAGAAGFYFLSRHEPPATETLAHEAATAIPPETAAGPARLAETVPDFQLADRAGQMRSLKDWSGKSLIVNFWATWCAPCRREIPLLQQIARERAADGFQVVGIAVDFRDKVLAYADQMKIEYPLLIGEQEGLDAATAFGVEAVGFPFTVFTDAQGRIVVAHLGELTAAEADLILGAVAQVNSGRVDLAKARADIAAGLPALQHDSDAKSGG